MPDQKAEAARVRGRFKSQVIEIRNNLELSDQGHQAAMAREWVRALDEITALESAFWNTINDEQDRLEKAVYAFGGTAIDAINFRDAIERVEQCEDRNEAERLYDRAEKINDEALMRALLVVGIERGWRSVIALYGAKHPPAVEALNDLASIRDFTTDAREKIAAKIAFTAPAKPQELSGLDIFRLRELAKETVQ